MLFRSAAEFDYVIVGAGSAGCVLAARLTEDRDVTVLLLEAGGSDWNPLVSIPIGIGKLHQHRYYDWGFFHEPTPNVAGRSLVAARGKLLGGSSSINNMAYVRGHRGDYDRWAARGYRGWSYADVLPYFRRCEDWEGGADAWRGAGGPLKTEYLHNPDPVVADWMQACRDAGFPQTDDYNGAVTEGFGQAQSTVGNGRRSSAAVAYLRPARRRPNLTVVTRAPATRVLLEKSRAVGVEYLRRGRPVRAMAKREVLLSEIGRAHV